MPSKAKKACRIVILAERCKGCGLCANVCPNDLITMSDELSRFGSKVYRIIGEESCTGCGFCALICPDMAIVRVEES